MGILGIKQRNIEEMHHGVKKFSKELKTRE
jgi:hypothetical protein